MFCNFSASAWCLTLQYMCTVVIQPTYHLQDQSPHSSFQPFCVPASLVSCTRQWIPQDNVGFQGLGSQKEMLHHVQLRSTFQAYLKSKAAKGSLLGKFPPFPGNSWDCSHDRVKPNSMFPFYFLNGIVWKNNPVDSPNRWHNAEMLVWRTSCHLEMPTNVHECLFEALKLIENHEMVCMLFAKRTCKLLLSLSEVG